MKLTLRYSTPLSPNNDYVTAPYKCSTQAITPHRPAGYRAGHAAGHPLASWGYWVNTQPGLVPAYKNTSVLPNLIKLKQPYLLKPHPYSPGLTNISIFNKTSSSSRQPPPSLYSSSPETWAFCFAEQALCNNTACIQLTAIESMLIKTLTRSNERVCSKHELIIGINKDAYSYSGLEMCLSRLQSKFKGTFGERLFRSVRNRGYCLVQEVQAID